MVYIRPVDSIATMFLPLSNTVFGGALGTSIQKGPTECSGACRLGDLAHRSSEQLAVYPFPPGSPPYQGASRSSSNSDPILDHRVFRNDHDIIPDEVLLPVEVFDAGFVQYLDSGSDSCVFIYDRAPDIAIPSKPDSRVASRFVTLQFIEILIEISSHHQHALEPGSVLYPASDADD